MVLALAKDASPAHAIDLSQHARKDVECAFASSAYLLTEEICTAIHGLVKTASVTDMRNSLRGLHHKIAQLN